MNFQRGEDGLERGCVALAIREEADTHPGQDRECVPSR